MASLRRRKSLNLVDRCSRAPELKDLVELRPPTLSRSIEKREVENPSSDNQHKLSIHTIHLINEGRVLHRVPIHLEHWSSKTIETGTHGSSPLIQMPKRDQNSQNSPQEILGGGRLSPAAPSTHGGGCWPCLIKKTRTPSQ